MNNLKRSFNLLWSVLLIISSLISIALSGSDYTFIAHSNIIMWLIIIAINSACTVYSVSANNTASGLSIFCALTMPVIMLAYCLTTIMFVFPDNHCNSLYFGTIFAISMFESFTVMFRHTKSLPSKIFSAITSIILIIPIAFVLFFCFAFTDFSKNIITDELQSPDKSMLVYAVQSPPANNTSIRLRNSVADIPLLTGRLQKNPVTIRHFDNSAKYSLEWIDNDTLSISGIQYNAPHILQSTADSNYIFSTHHGIYVPDRTPDYFLDTHSGFLGDGDTVERYSLTPAEIILLETNISENTNWTDASLISTDHLEILTDKFSPDIYPTSEASYICFYDSLTDSFMMPPEKYSSNYVLWQYYKSEKTLYVFEWDS